MNLNQLKKSILYLLYSIISITSIQAQQPPPPKIDKFSDNPEEIVKQLDQYMGASKNDTYIKAFKEWEKAYKEGAFLPEEMPRIAAVCNNLMALRMGVGSHFMPYLLSLPKIKKAEKGTERFVEFHNMMDATLANVAKNQPEIVKSVLEFANYFFEKNTLFTDNYFAWTTANNTFKLEFKDGKPTVKFEKTDLFASRNKDSIQIAATSGTYFPAEYIFKGKGGKTIWFKNKEAKDVFALLDTFSIDIKKMGYSAQNVKLNYPQFFKNNQPLGKVEDKVVVENKAVEGSYPRYESYENIIKLDDIGGGAEYIGGFRLQGLSVYGYGTKEQKSSLAIYNEQRKKLFQGYADIFIIRRGEKVVGERVLSSMYFGKDSITHPSSTIRYDIVPKELTLERGDKASDRNPFANSFHNVNMQTEKITWIIPKDTVIINEKRVLASAADTKVTLESLKFYDENEYNRIQGVGNTNPIATLQNVSLTDGKEIDAEALAKKINPTSDLKSIQTLYYEMVSKGFIEYDSEKKRVLIKDKVNHYANASQKKADFDNISILSDFEKSNAVLDLKDSYQGMTIQGVKSLELSPRQRVAVKPTNNKLTLRQNRNLLFDGKMFAGFGVFQGKGYDFDYEKFQVKMDSIRYFDLFVPNPEKTDKNGNPQPTSLGSRIEYLSGILLIDAPNNKSGRENIPIFPSIQTKTPSFVYYDYPETQGGAYTRDSFFFRLDPFSFNSLDRFKQEDVKFKGTLVSSSIFPDFQEALVVQKEDQSLGFVTQTPTEGYPIYLKKGNFQGGISLSNKGVFGKGKLAYLGSETQSEDLLFKPKQLTGTSKNFDLKEDRTSVVKTPQIKGKDVTINWLPYRDSLYVSSKGTPFDIFKDGQHTLKGLVILTPEGAKGNGEFSWTKAIINSKLMSFGAHSVKSDTMNLQIRAFGAEDLAFDTRNVNGSVDFDEQIGKFKSNSNILNTVMPYNKYQTSMNEFDWDLKNETITFKSDLNKPALFLSIHHEQDSLRFFGKTAFYDLKTSELKIGGVEEINAGGAIIYPEKGVDIFIRPGGNMDTLSNAKIVCDTVNKYHVINKATVHVEGRKLYHASGFYEYNIPGKDQEVLLNNILGSRVGKGKSSEKPVITNATGDIQPDDSFYIDRKTRFKGTISLHADQRNLQFDGFAKLDVEGLPNHQWFSVSSEGDKNDLAIRYDVPKTEESEPVRNGIFLSKEVGAAYPIILSPTYFRTDRPILDVKGVFKYNHKTNDFIFGDTSKILQSTKKGNKLFYNLKDSTLKGEGRIELGSGLKYTKVMAAGTIKGNLKPVALDSSGTPSLEDMKLSAKVMAGVEAYIPEKLMQALIAELQGNLDGAFVDYTKENEFYEKALAEFVPDEKELQTVIAYSKERSLDLPKKNNPYAFLFSNLPLQWNNEYQSFLSTTEKFGLSSVGGVPINRMVTGFVEFRMPANGDDRFYIYMKAGSEKYYFFGYQQGILNVISNSDSFMAVFDKLKKGELSKKMDDGELYELQAVDEGTAQMFARRVKDGIK